MSERLYIQSYEQKNLFKFRYHWLGLFFDFNKKIRIIAFDSAYSRPVRLMVRTPDFQSGNRGSIPLRATKNKQTEQLARSVLIILWGIFTTAIELILCEIPVRRVCYRITVLEVAARVS